MSEKLYALLLRLYPARFRAHYGGEAMQVFRDRMRDERSPGARLRLWLDVMADLWRSMPQEHRRAAAPIAAIPAPGGLRVPSFSMLEDEALRPGRFVLGAVLALAGLGAFAFLLNHGGNPTQYNVVSYGSPRSGAQFGGSGAGASDNPPARGGAPAGFQLDQAEQHRVIQAIVGEMSGPYREASGARAITEALSTREANGDYAQIAEGDIFASALTTQMHAITSDPEVSVYFTAGRKSQAPPGAQRIDEHFAMTIQ
jgi:hypothetical protein